MFAALVANFVVGSEILIGGAGVIAGLTGISQYAAVWLLPLVIVAYGAFSSAFPAQQPLTPYSLDRRSSSHFCVCTMPYADHDYYLSGFVRADYLHCVILFTSLLVLVLATYTRGDVIGSPGKLYDLLVDASEVKTFYAASTIEYWSLTSDRRARWQATDINPTSRFEVRAACVWEPITID